MGCPAANPVWARPICCAGRLALARPYLTCAVSSPCHLKRRASPCV